MKENTNDINIQICTLPRATCQFEGQCPFVLERVFDAHFFPSRFDQNFI
jgi:hypothetical protein